MKETFLLLSICYANHISLNVNPNDLYPQCTTEQLAAINTLLINYSNDTLAQQCELESGHENGNLVISLEDPNISYHFHLCGLYPSCRSYFIELPTRMLALGNTVQCSIRSTINLFLDVKPIIPEVFNVLDIVQFMKKDCDYIPLLNDYQSNDVNRIVNKFWIYVVSAALMFM